MLDNEIQNTDSITGHVLMREVVQRERIRMDLVHGRAGVSHSADLVGVELLPPVQRSSQIHRNSNHPKILTVVRTGIGEVLKELMILLADEKLELRSLQSLSVLDVSPVGVTEMPGVHGVPSTTDGSVEAVNVYVFNLNHDDSQPPKYNT
jgi:hypothetical protein